MLLSSCSIAIWPLSMGNFWLTILDAVLLFVNAFFNYYVISQVSGDRRCRCELCYR